MTTVSAVRRALEEAAENAALGQADATARDLRLLANNSLLVTLLANRLSDRGTAGNAAATRNLRDLRQMLGELKSLPPQPDLPGFDALAKRQADALEWAIDQLTPPERA